MTAQTVTQATCRVCGRPTDILMLGARTAFRPHCSDACFYAEHPAQRPRSDVPPDMPRLSLAQRREMDWQKSLPDRQQRYDYHLLKARAKDAGALLADYEGEKSILISGASEAGKTFVAYRLARLAYMAGKRVLCLTADEARAKWLSEGGGERFLNRLKTVGLLLLDDLGMENATDGWRSAVYEVFNRRELDGLPSIVTVNRVKSYYAQTYSTGLANRLWRMEEVKL